MKQLLQFVLFILFGIFLIVGFVLGASVGYANSNHASPAVEETVPTPTSPNTAANGQHNLLFILVDRLDAETPQLEGVWLILSLPPNPQFTLLPLYPALDGKALVDQNLLTSTFIITPEQQPAEDFFQVLKTSNLWWMNWLVVDRSGLAEAIDLTGGLDQGSGIISAEAIVTSLIPPWQSQASALENQASLIHSLCQRQIEEAQINILLRRFSKLAPHLYSDIETESLAAAWKPLLRSENKDFLCEFPTLR